jgi:sugar/nucleoside kinase (ribokinase family)
LLPVTAIGDDGHGFDLRRELAKLPVDPSFIVKDEQRLTPTYTKPMRADHQGLWRELNRLDVRTRAPLSPPAEARLLTLLDQAVQQADGVIVRRLGDFAFGVLKGNRSEAVAAAGLNAGDPAAVEKAAELLARRTGRAVFITQAEQGVLFKPPAGPCERAPAIPVPGPIDIVGAGDSVTASLTASLLSGAELREAAEIASLVASITIQQLGTTGVATPQQVLERREAAG